MFTPSILMNFVILLSSIITLTRCKNSKSLSKEVYIDQKVQLMGYDVVNTTIEYLTCQKTGNLELNCGLTKQTHYFSGKLYTSYCDITGYDERIYETSKKSRVFTLDTDKTILVRGVTYTIDRSMSLKLLIVTWENCKIATGEIPLEDRSSDLDRILDRLSIISRSNNYEAIYEDSKACNDWCYVKFIENGDKLTAPIEMDPKVAGSTKGSIISWHVNSDRLRSSDSCFETYSAERLDVSIFLSVRVKDILENRNASTAIKISTANGMWILCKHEEPNRRSLVCTRGDTLSWHFLNFHYVVQDFVIYSLPENRILTITSRKSKPTETHLVFNGTPSFTYYLTIFENYETVRSIEIAKLECSRGTKSKLYTHVYEKSLGEYCITLVSWENPLKLVFHCYSQKYLTTMESSTVS
ncbi:hypothetical protein QAD02_008852 [Eretmocerus hayati]|uniref:Uncharacterized protein n=1 Tax=Eretmocerus hayati TaxID=131215 RepID=A0ACC2N7M9_9HYME|nr:hypothetical protein QAD02_008852 [Eretmocerus hayati]